MFRRSGERRLHGGGGGSWGEGTGEASSPKPRRGPAGPVLACFELGHHATEVSGLAPQASGLLRRSLEGRGGASPPKPRPARLRRPTCSSCCSITHLMSRDWLRRPPACSADPLMWGCFPAKTPPRPGSAGPVFFCTPSQPSSKLGAALPRKKTPPFVRGGVLSGAEMEGFEPPVPLPVHRISSAAHSTTLAHLRGKNSPFKHLGNTAAKAWPWHRT